MSELDCITRRVNLLGDPNDPATPIPLLTLEEFFTGNFVDGSICCNLEPCPTPQEVYTNLLEIRNRPNVSDVRVQITAFDDPDWPFSDTVWVFTDADEATVNSWIPSHIAPDEYWEGWIESLTYEQCEIMASHKPIAIWWD